jgi:hypothetical protein
MVVTPIYVDRDSGLGRFTLRLGGPSLSALARDDTRSTHRHSPAVGLASTSSELPKFNDCPFWLPPLPAQFR